MSSNDEQSQINATILRAVNNYKTVTGARERIFSYDSPKPNKRSASSTSSIDDCGTITPLKKFKASNNILCNGSPSEFRRIKCDLLASRNYTKELEKQLTQMRALSKEEQIVYEHETKRWKSQAERDRKSIEELEARLDSIKQRELGIQNELSEEKAKFGTYKNETEMQVQDLESQLNNLKEEIHDQSTDENSAITKLERQVEELQILYKAAQEETDAHKKFVEELKEKLKQQNDLENELEVKTQALSKAQQQIKRIEFTRESYREFQLQSKSQQQKLSNYETLERENAQLREENHNLKNDVHNKLLLEEKVHDLKVRLEKYKEQEMKLHTLTVSNSQTEMYLEEFRSLARSICETTNADASLPRLLRSMVERLQQQELTLTTEKIQLDSSLSTATHEAKVAKDELDKCRLHIANLDKDLKQAKTQMSRMHRKLQLITGERDSYRKQLDSYEKDLTICVNPASLATPGTAQMQSQFERIKNLERTVDEYRDIVHKLETDLKNAEGYPTTDNIPIRAEQMARLQMDLAKLKNENILLRERKDRLEIQLEDYLVGHDAASGRIIHNAKNPLSDFVKQREIEKERLEEEVVALKRKIKKLEEGADASRLGDITIDHKEVQILKEKVASSEKKIVRLKEYFQGSMQEFRDVVYMLFGYKIDSSQMHQYKVTSMYAERKEDLLCFQLSDDGAFNLLENEYSGSLDDFVDLHLRQQKSIPVFLSSLTLDLFSNNTMTKTYDIDEDDDDEDDDDEDDEEEQEEENGSEEDDD